MTCSAPSSTAMRCTWLQGYLSALHAQPLALKAERAKIQPIACRKTGLQGGTQARVEDRFQPARPDRAGLAGRCPGGWVCPAWGRARRGGRGGSFQNRKRSAMVSQETPASWSHGMNRSRPWCRSSPLLVNGDPAPAAQKKKGYQPGENEQANQGDGIPGQGAPLSHHRTVLRIDIEVQEIAINKRNDDVQQAE